MAQLGDDFKEQVRARTDIVALIGEALTLRPTNGGREFVGLCPFHDDHSPSMRVYPQRQSFRCWSCQTGGDCFTFVMKHESVSFREALEMLAKRANLELPKRFHHPETDSGVDKSTLHDVLAWAEQQFHECLLRDPLAEKARDYLFRERRLTRATVEQFKLGYHPQHSQWIINKAGRKFPIEQLEAVWLIKQGDQGGYYDMFRDRVLYPIRDTQGRTVAFGGRVLPGTESTGGKYINSADTPVFHKSHLLYGLDQAKLALRQDGHATLVEGYMDVIACHQAGVRNVVAGLGTALGITHVNLLKRFTERVTLLLDGDEAGQRATDKALRVFLSQGVDLRVLSLPDNLDPDEYIDAHGVDAFRQVLATACDAWDHKLRTSVATHGLDTVIARQRVLEEMLDALSDLSQEPAAKGTSWELRESIMLTRLMQQLGVKETDLRRQLAELRARKSKQAGRIRPDSPEGNDLPVQAAELFPAKPTADELAERDLLCLILAEPDRWNTFQNVLRPSEFQNARLAQLFDVCLKVADQGRLPSYETVTLATENLDLKNLAELVAAHAEEVQNFPELAEHTLAYFRRRRELTEGSRPLQKPHLSLPSGALNSDALERLRQATHLHQKRAGKPT